MKRHLLAAAAALVACRRRSAGRDDAERRHVGGGRQPARSAPRDHDAGQAADRLGVQRPGALQAGLGKPRGARARPRRALGELARQADLDLPSAQGRQVPRRLRRAHRRRRGVLAQARRRPEVVLLLRRLRADRVGRGGRSLHGAHQAETGGAGLPRPRHQLPRRLRRQPQGGREARREFPAQPGRHRPLPVRDLQAERERHLRRPTRTTSAARRRSTASSIG